MKCHGTTTLRSFVASRLSMPGSTQEYTGAGDPGQVGEPLPEGRVGVGRLQLQQLSCHIICLSQGRSVHVEDSHTAWWEPAGRAKLSKRQGAYPLPPQDSWLPCPESPAPWVQWRPLGRVCARSYGSGPSGRGGAATFGLGSCQPLTWEFGLRAGGPAGAHPEWESPQVRWLFHSCLSSSELASAGWCRGPGSSWILLGRWAAGGTLTLLSREVGEESQEGAPSG